VSRNPELERELEARELGPTPTLVGSSAAMHALQRTLASLRHNESTVLITGESGTGKELVAAALHAASPRRAGPFVPVDCGALPESIIESELFGHERGAFTGAVGAAGLFRLASSGTLFLDEIGEIPLAVQAKLLRALQTREVRPLGGGAALPVDIRVIGATNRDLAEMVAAGRFRQDLFYRLDVVRLALPPLRERREDVPLLAQHFLEKHRGRTRRARLRARRSRRSPPATGRATCAQGPSSRPSRWRAASGSRCPTSRCPARAGQRSSRVQSRASRSRSTPTSAPCSNARCTRAAATPRRPRGGSASAARPSTGSWPATGFPLRGARRSCRDGRAAGW
jgi:hypothetical protein